MNGRPAAAAAPRLQLLLLLAVACSSLLLIGAPGAAHAAALPSASYRLTVRMQQQLPLQQPGAAAAAAAAASAAAVASAAAGAAAAPVLAGYSFERSKDTFSLCREFSGLRHDVAESDLVSAFGLPRDLLRRRSTTLAQLVDLLGRLQPDVRVVWKPMLFGEADLGSLLSPAGLPKLVHFTVRDKNALQPHQVLSIASWAHHNPGYSLLLFDDDDVRGFMTTYYPELLPTFDGLGSQVERTDMWRYLVLCRLGGVYADSDVIAARPISTWAQDAGLLVGVENVFVTPEEAKRRSYARQVQMVQWVMAARRGHPVVCRMGRYVAAHVAEEAAGEYLDPDRDHSILERTGPGIWSSSVHDYLKQVANMSVEQVVAGGRIGDVRILPQPVFGCGSADFNPADPLPYVYHMFKGSWRQNPSRLVLLLLRLQELLSRRQQQHQSGSDALQAALAAAAAAANGSSSSGSSSRRSGQAKHPHLPILDEQIAEHRRQQQLEQQQLPRRAAAGRAHWWQQQQQQRQQQSIRLPAAAMAAGDTAAAAGQQLQQAATAAHVAADSRKLRSSQLLFVRGQSPADVAAGLEVELPSRALGTMPALSLLVLAVLVCSYAYKQQQGTGCSSWWGSQAPLLLASGAWGAASSSRAAPGGSGISSRSSLLLRGGVGSVAAAATSRPGSRMTYAGAAGGSGVVGSSSLPVLPLLAAGVAGAAAGSGAPRTLSDRQVVLQPEQEVCYASSQHHGNPHRHKRSWGSSSNFAQLERSLY